MKEWVFQIGKIPAILYGEKTDKVYLFIHGKCGYKEEAKEFGEIVCPRGWQVLGIDLPEHGNRKGETNTFVPWYVVPELQTVMAYAQQNWSCIGLRANSIGAWFSMLAFSAEPLEKSLFVSPILNMKSLTQTMMQRAGVTEGDLQAYKTVPTDFGETLSWRYYQYAKEHPIQMWPSPTSILYAEKDNLTSRQEVDDFIRCFPCDLTVLKGGEHWFHTPEQLEILRQWTDTQTAGEQTITEVVSALIWDGDKFMVCQRPAHKARGLLWEFVGGKVERGETKEQALIRECQEELAVTVVVGEVFMEVTHTYPDLTVHLTLFHAIIAEGTPQKLEHNDIRWITTDEIDHYQFCPADEEILDRLRSKSK